MLKIAGEAQGTTYHVSYYSIDETSYSEINDRLDLELKRIDKELSNYRTDSTISIIDNDFTTEPIQSTEEINNLLRIAHKVYNETNRCYDLTIRPLFDIWGFSQKQLTIPTPTDLKLALSAVGMDKITYDANTITKSDPKLRIDLSSIAQGYTVGRMAEILESFDIKDYLVELGGEMLVRGKKDSSTPWTVGIEAPVNNLERSVVRTIKINSQKTVAVMTSGTYRHYFDKNGKKYPHIIDPRDGKPVQHKTVSVTVIHENPTLADAWSTALTCLGSQNGLIVANKLNLSVLFIDSVNDKLEYKSSKSYKEVIK